MHYHICQKQLTNRKSVQMDTSVNGIALTLDRLIIKKGGLNYAL